MGDTDGSLVGVKEGSVVGPFVGSTVGLIVGFVGAEVVGFAVGFPGNQMGTTSKLSPISSAPSPLLSLSLYPN